VLFYIFLYFAIHPLLTRLNPVILCNTVHKSLLEVGEFLLYLVKTCFSKYVDFNGRARRSEYWYFFLFNMIITVIAAIIAQATGATIVSTIVSLALLLPGLAVSVRRLHDIGKKWTWLLISLIPIVGEIWLIILNCKDSEPGDNQFGPNPKEA